MNTTARRRTALVLLTALAALAILIGCFLIVQQSGATASVERPLTAADGVIEDGAQPDVFDDSSPAVANLNPDLLAALRAAATAAEVDGVRIVVNSGWRSPELQASLLEQAVAEYGSAEEAARWVASPEHSEHVAGDAVDIGRMPALDWMAQHSAEYGLCQVYANERWHFELRPAAIANGCPEMYADPTADPRMQR